MYIFQQKQKQQQQQQQQQQARQPPAAVFWGLKLKAYGSNHFL
jgi:hypothetical protein